MEIKLLKSTDSNAFFHLRLEGLKLIPSAFGASFVDENTIGPSRWDSLLGQTNQSNVIYGAFNDGVIVGCIGVMQESGSKAKHKAKIWGMYVKQEFQGQGLGKRLVRQAIEHARSIPNVKLINLSVEPGNTSARALYTSCGFISWGTEPKALLVDGKFYDEDHMMLQF